MKRLFSLTLCLMMSLFLSACGSPAAETGPIVSLESPGGSEIPAVQPNGAEQDSAPHCSADSEQAWSWPVDSPGNQGLDSAALDTIHAEFDTFPLLSSKIIKNGRLIDTYYKDGYDDSSVFLMHSTSKSITSTLIGIAIDQGKIESVDVPLSEYLPQVLELEDSAWRQITIRHLLTHTSGIATTDGSRWKEWRSSDNWLEYILALPIVSVPGTEFSYSTGNTHLLCVVLEKATGMTLYDFGKEVLFDPMEMSSVQIDTDPQGIGDGGNGIWLNTSDMAKFGQMYLNSGAWKGRQIVSSDWVNQATSLQFDRSTGSADYGYQWWVRTFGELQYDAYFAQGHFGQYIFVVPQLELVVCFTSQYDGSSSIYWQLMNAIVSACDTPT